MGEKFATGMIPGDTNFNPETQMMIFFSEQTSNATNSIKEEIAAIREAERLADHNKAEHRRLDAERKSVLAGLRGDNTPANLNQINKVLRDIIENENLSDEQRQRARDLLKEINVTKPSFYANDRLPQADWERLQEIAKRYGLTESPPIENKREPILAWISNNTGQKHGRPYIGTPTTKPAATPGDIQFLNGIKSYLNEGVVRSMPAQAEPVDWKKINDQLELLVTDHFESLKPDEKTEDSKVRLLKMDLALQQYNTAISTASASAKTIHDLKKGIAEKF